MFDIQKMAARLRELYYNNKGGAGDDPFVLAVEEWTKEISPPVFVVPPGFDPSTLLVNGLHPGMVVQIWPSPEDEIGRDAVRYRKLIEKMEEDSVYVRFPYEDDNDMGTAEKLNRYLDTGKKPDDR